MSITDTTGRTDADVVSGAGSDDVAGHIDLTEASRAEALTPPEHAMTEAPTSRPQFTITDAAVACAVSRKTITRKLGDLAEHGAAKDDDGIWRIPVEALLAVGLHPGRSLGSTQAPTPRPMAQTPGPVATARPEHVAGDMVTVSRDRWDDLRIRLARAEAEASERALALADARLALRALTAAPAAQPVPPEHVLPTRDALQDASRSPGTQRPVASSWDDGAAGTDPTPSGSAALNRPAEPLRDSPTAAAVRTPPSAPHDRAVEGAEPDVAPVEMIVPDPAAGIASARSQAARTGGYVPAAGSTKGSKRRWWHGK